MLPLNLGTPGEGLGAETSHEPLKAQWWAKKILILKIKNLEKALIPDPQQQTKAMIIWIIATYGGCTTWVCKLHTEFSQMRPRIFKR
jgi:hypothetical protein